MALLHLMGQICMAWRKTCGSFGFEALQVRHGQPGSPLGWVHGIGCWENIQEMMDFTIKVVGVSVFHENCPIIQHLGLFSGWFGLFSHQINHHLLKGFVQCRICVVYHHNSQMTSEKKNMPNWQLSPRCLITNPGLSGPWSIPHLRRSSQPCCQLKASQGKENTSP